MNKNSNAGYLYSSVTRFAFSCHSLVHLQIGGGITAVLEHNMQLSQSSHTLLWSSGGSRSYLPFPVGDPNSWETYSAPRTFLKGGEPYLYGGSHAVEGVLIATYLAFEERTAQEGEVQRPIYSVTWIVTMEFNYLFVIKLVFLFQAYSVYDEEIGYCQGHSFLAAVLLLHVSTLQN